MPGGAVKKCKHGNGHEPGINKDTNSCFSTNGELYHAKAAQLAEQATFEYLETVRKTIQNDAFLSLLDLSFGSALAIALDTSSSMSNEIEAVKAEIVQIIAEANAGGVRPSIYILAAYETNVTVTVTKDDAEIAEALDKLNASGSRSGNAMEMSLS